MTGALLVCAGSGQRAQGADAQKSLAERLGYGPEARILIINADDAGMCHSANRAVIDSLERGLLRSATVMVPCPWFPELAAYAKENPQRAFGVHLSHTSEWKKYRWGPVAPKEQVPGLVDPTGYLWSGIMQVYAHATPEQALLEGRAQIHKALSAGIDVTHLDSHMGTLQLHPDYLQVYLQLAKEFNLPVRMAAQATMAARGYPQVREMFTTNGIVFPDYFIYEELEKQGQDVKGFWMQIVGNLKPGVTELYIHPALTSDELKAITGTWQTRNREYEVFTTDPDMRKLIEDRGIQLISYRPLRDLQRKSAASPQGGTLPGQ